MSTLILASTLAYLKWTSATAQNSRRQVAEMQAYYYAQAGIIQGPLAWLRSHPMTDIEPHSMIPLENGTVFGVGQYEDAKIEKMYPQEYRTKQVGSPSSEYLLLSAVGVASYENFDETKKLVRRRATLRIDYRNFKGYFYLTHSETTRFGETIPYWMTDSLDVKIHSNSNFTISAGSVSFVRNGFISSSQNILINNQPVNSYHCRSNQPIIQFRERANQLRSAAAGGGQYFQSHGGSITYGIRFEGGMASVWQWQTGTPSPMTQNLPPISAFGIPIGSNLPIFCDGELWLMGDIYGRVGIGAEGNIRILDNLTYSGSLYQNLPYSQPDRHLFSMISVISEAGDNLNMYNNDPRRPLLGIIIANTPANGRGGGRAAPATSQHLRDIALYGHFIALNGSITFEDQNDIRDPFIQPLPNQYGQNNDERGTIFLRGAMAMKCRDYFHRSNQGGTGYAKGFLYDTRLSSSHAPFAEDLFYTNNIFTDQAYWLDLPGDRNLSMDAPYRRGPVEDEKR